MTLGVAALVALGLASSASAADDPLGAVTQAAAPVTNAAAPTVTTAAAGTAETAQATTAAAQTAAKAVHPPSATTDRDLSDTVRSAGAVVDSAARTAKRTADAAVATTTHVADAATRPPATPTAATPHTAAPAQPKPPGLKVESSHARPPSRHPSKAHHRTVEPPAATAARALDPTPAPLVAAPIARQAAVAPPVLTGHGERVAGAQPASPAAPAHGGAAAAGASAAASGAGIAALLIATFLLATPAIRRRLPAPSPGHWPAAPVFLLERPG
jgi:hypothetical protein